MVKKYIDNLFFTWSVMGKQNNTAKFGVPGFFDCSGVPGCSGVLRGVPECSGVPVFRCSGVPVFRCSGVPGFSTCRPRGGRGMVGLNDKAIILFPCECWKYHLNIKHKLA